MGRLEHPLQPSVPYAVLYASVIPNLFRNLTIKTMKRGMLKQVQHDNYFSAFLYHPEHPCYSERCVLRLAMSSYTAKIGS
jgi:hypothetical protein